MQEQNKELVVDELEQVSLRAKCVRNLGRVAGLGAAAATTALGGAMLLPLETQIGPHKAEVVLDFDGDATGEVGGIGAIDKPIDLPLGLGVEVQLREVPINTSDQASDELLSGADIEAYARLLSEPEQTIDSIKNDLEDRAKTHAALGAAITAAIYLSYGKARRKELSEKALHSPAVKFAAVTAILASGVGINSAAARPNVSTPVSHMFDGTFLEGAEIRGKYMQLLVNEYGTKVIELLNENDDFYDTAIANLRTEAEKNYLLKNDPRYTTIDFTTDRHCNFGMSRVVGALADISAPDITLDAGDITMGGTALEEQCIAVAANYTKGELILAAGNHDSDATEEQAKSYGFKVLDGKVIEVNGLRILGDEDPMRSMFLKPAYQKGKESIEDLNQRLANTACDEKAPIDILLVHHDEAAEETLARGCAQIALSGHTHKYDIWRHPDSLSLQIVGGSTGGATRNASTFGPLKAPAEVIRIQFSKSSGKYVRSQRIVVDENANTAIHAATYGSYRSEEVE